MSNEASKTKSKFGYLEKRIFCGRGIDIGCGNDPIYPDATSFDIADGDANEITKFVHEKFDYVFSSHCLEHMRNPYKAIKEWWKIVKPGGFLYIIVPDEDRYEQGVFPSIWNADHKYTFTIHKTASWSPVSINIIDMVKRLPDAEILKIEIQDDRYDYTLHDVDQTFQGNGMDAMAQIAVVLQKNSISASKFQSLKIRFFYAARKFYSRIKMAKASFVLAKEKFYSPKYSGIHGKIHFFCKSFRILFSHIPYKTIMYKYLYIFQKYITKFYAYIYTHNPVRKKIFFFLPNGLGDAIINKVYIDKILHEKHIIHSDAVILASDAWKDFKNIFPSITIHYFNLEKFEKSHSYRIKIYKILGCYTFEYAICNLKWKSPLIFKNIMAQVNANHKYACLYHKRHQQLNDELKTWGQYFGINIYTNNMEISELQRIADFYVSIGMLDKKQAERTTIQYAYEDNDVFSAPYIIFHIGNSDKRRRWNIQKFNIVARSMRDKGYDVLFCGGKHEEDILPYIGKEFKSYIGVLSAEEYTRLISKSSLMLSGDTGPAHLSLALNVPTAILLGGGHYKNYFPYPEDITPPLNHVTYITTHKDCFGCDWECIFSDGRRFSCVHDISSDDVIRAINALLAQISPDTFTDSTLRIF